MSIRTERVGRLVQREIADLLNITFGDAFGRMVTVTGAKVTRDLSIAYVYFSTLGDTQSERESTLRSLEELTPRIRKELGSRIRHQVRKIPELRFIHDDSLTEAARIDELLDAARRQRVDREHD